MARVSRKKQNIPTTPADTPVRIWKTALYVRLSVEDNGKDSDSVENQTALLEEYVANHPHLKKVALFVDNGYTGTDFAVHIDGDAGLNIKSAGTGLHAVIGCVHRFAVNGD